MNEVWKDIIIEKNGVIQDYSGRYQISNLGRVKSLFKQKNNYKEKILLGNPDTKGYLQVQLFYESKRYMFAIHRLVANAFMQNKNNYKACSEEKNIDLNKLQINHKDTDKTNNKLSNLEWCTNLYNMRHAIKNGVYINAFSEERKEKCRETLDKYRPIAVKNRIENNRKRRMNND